MYLCHCKMYPLPSISDAENYYWPNSHMLGMGSPSRSTMEEPLRVFQRPNEWCNQYSVVWYSVLVRHLSRSLKSWWFPAAFGGVLVSECWVSPHLVNTDNRFWWHSMPRCATSQVHSGAFCGKRQRWKMCKGTSWWCTASDALLGILEWAIFVQNKVIN